MRLHRDVGIQMVERAISLFAALPSALIHALDLFIAPARTLVLLRAGNRHERVDLEANQSENRPNREGGPLNAPEIWGHTG